ncbi:MAG: hypothetical protein J6I98_04785, partial [Clostridia bacterium]|nr:hypothetical protein [Clostridia bacterium]
MNDDYLEYTLGALADYDEEELLFTEDELLQRVTEVLDLQKAYNAEPFSDISHYQSYMTPGYNKMDADPNDNITTERFENGLDPLNGIEPRENVTMIPIYADEGGTTASILSFCAI